jgi:DNA-directed RNA polymerase specialized sigma24 family protein
LDNARIFAYQKSVQAIAFKILRNQFDAEEIAQDALINLLEFSRKSPEVTPNLKWIVINAIRRRYGHTRTKRFQFKHAERNAKAIVGSLESDEEFGQFVSEEHLNSGVLTGEREEPLFDEELFARVGADTSLFEGAARELARDKNVTESRISQLKSREEDRVVRAYLWELYKEHRIETKIEVDWIAI